MHKRSIEKDAKDKCIDRIGASVKKATASTQKNTVRQRNDERRRDEKST